VCMADNLPPSSADVMQSGSLNLPEPSGPHRPVMWMLYLFTGLLLPGSVPYRKLYFAYFLEAVIFFTDSVDQNLY
jgi:hypothetical protein